MSSQPQPPKRKRTFQACQACRARKARCITPDDSCIGPCTRCVAKNLVCVYGVDPGPAEYPGQQAAGYSGQQAAYPNYQAPQPPQHYPAPQAPYAHAAPVHPPPLPYTGPPPMHTRARYADGAYPDLSLRPGSASTRQSQIASRQPPAQGTFPQQTYQYPYPGQYPASAPGQQYPPRAG